MRAFYLHSISALESDIRPSMQFRRENHNYWSRHVVLIVTIDFRNGVNSARWTHMARALEHTLRIPAYLLRTVDSYLKNHAVLYDTLKCQWRISVTTGVTYRSNIQGPILDTTTGMYHMSVCWEPTCPQKPEYVYNCYL